MMIRITLVTVLMGLYCGSAAARTVAVAPPQYIDLAGGENVADAAQKVQVQILEGVAEAGFEAVTGDEVAAVVMEESVEGQCDKACLQRVAVKLQVDDVIVVKIEDDEQVTYRSTVSFAVRDDVSDERTAGFYVVLEWLKGALALALKQEATTTLAKAEGPNKPADMVSDDAGEENADSANTEEPSKKKLGKVPFIVAAGTTAVLGVTTLILNGVAHKKYETTEDSIDMNTADRDEALSEIDKVENLQTAVKVGLVATGVGLVATGVLALLTDFSSSADADEKPENSKDNDVALTPGIVLGPTFGAFSIGGTF